MPSRRIPPGEPEPEPTIDPPYYEATENLYVHSPDADAMPALAYRTGDRIVPDVIEANGWGGKVRIPDIYIGQLSPTRLPAEAEATAPASQSAGTAGTEE